MALYFECRINKNALLQILAGFSRWDCVRLLTSFQNVPQKHKKTKTPFTFNFHSSGNELIFAMP